jgi:D-alanyl-D-alanine carboxypeptidase/D-alanyl-D-alanine-endopeptidase (penicillin-binding protein 4)
MFKLKIALIYITLIIRPLIGLSQDINVLIDNKLNELSGPERLVGFQLMDLKTGELVYGWNDTMQMIPASIQKCITAFSAIHFLGEDYKFQTPISFTGEVLRDGNLTGNIIIEGSGDPSMGSTKHFNIQDPDQFFNAIAKRISKTGINCIDGDLIIDVSEFGRSVVPRKWFWEDLGNYYGAGVWGLNFNDNIYNIYLDRENIIDAPVQVDHIEPNIPGLVHHSNIRTAEVGTGDQAYIFGAPYTYERTIEGTIPKGEGLFKIRGSLPDPPTYFGQQLALAMRRENISFRSLVIQYEPAKYQPQTKINSLQSPELVELVERMLEDSQNMYAEAFVKRIGNGDHDIGINKIVAYMLESGLDLKGRKTVDGSGLSVLNRISPDQMNNFLLAQCRRFGIKKIKRWFPLAGKEGTVAYMFKDGPASGHVWIKSGSMDGVLCYHGIIMINGDITSRTKARQSIESLLNLVYQNQL